MKKCSGERDSKDTPNTSESEINVVENPGVPTTTAFCSETQSNQDSQGGNQSLVNRIVENDETCLTTNSQRGGDYDRLGLSALPGSSLDGYTPGDSFHHRGELIQRVASLGDVEEAIYPPHLSLISNFQSLRLYYEIQDSNSNHSHLSNSILSSESTESVISNNHIPSSSVNTVESPSREISNEDSFNYDYIIDDPDNSDEYLDYHCEAISAPHDASCIEHSVGSFDYTCVHCDARYFKGEAERDRSFVKCCNRGAYTNIPAHKGLPSLLFNLFTGSHPRSRDFMRKIRVEKNSRCKRLRRKLGQ